MLTVALQGGLGNQLFQCALGLALEARGQQVQYDPTILETGARKYMLDQFGLNLRFGKAADRAPIRLEGSLRFQPEILDTRQESVLLGYWQCEKYFLPVASKLCDLMTWVEVGEKTKVVERLIWHYGERSCFVHVRRTDNLRPEGLRVHGLLTADGCDYYERAMKLMRERVPGVRFFVFSDDPEWCDEHFTSTDIVTTVSHNSPSFIADGYKLTRKDGGREVEDLWLMSKCRHAIIANSSFSWWGAWLYHDQRNRTVIAPRAWFASPDYDATDICPERWECI